MKDDNPELKDIFDLLKKEFQSEFGEFADGVKSKISPELQEGLEKTQHEVEEFTKKHPILTIVIAVIVGFLIARIFTGKRD